MALGNCFNCLWWWKLKEPRREKPGECHRYAPRMLGGAGTGWAEWEWPLTMPGEFCGEWALQRESEDTDHE